MTVNEDTVRYPQSIKLFQFCKEALNVKHGYEVKIIDQHVGALLGFDPADCSHWKKGKKNVKSIHAIQSIADYLGTDASIISNILSQKMDVEESLQEYIGYGDFSLSRKAIEDLKREYYTNTNKFQVSSFEELIAIEYGEILKLTESLLKKAQISTFPVMLPEVFAQVSNVTLHMGKSSNQKTVHGTATDIYCKSTEFKPYTRLLVAKALGKALLHPTYPAALEKLVDVRSNIFAINLLMPSYLVKNFIESYNSPENIVDALSQQFWVNPSLVNARLQDLLSH